MPFPRASKALRPLHRARFDPRAVGADLCPPARRLGRQRHQDRDAARPRRADGRAARRRRFSEPASQQAQHDAELESAGRARRVQAHGEKGRRRGGEFPSRREEAARHRLQIARQDQSAHRLRQHFRLRPGRPLRQPAGFRSDRARHGRTDVGHRPARARPGPRRHSDRRSQRRTVGGDRHPGRAAGAREIQKGPAGRHLAPAGADLHARLSGRPLSGAGRSRQAGRQQSSDQRADRRLQDRRRLHQYRHGRADDLETVLRGHRGARARCKIRTLPTARHARRTAMRSTPRSIAISSAAAAANGSNA